MGITVDLGLQRFYRAEDENWPKALEALVASGWTNLVRDVIPFAKPRVYEAARTDSGVSGRWLSPDEAAPILADWEELGDKSPEWSWDDFAELGIECQTLEVVFDRPRIDRIGVVLAGDDNETWVDDLEHSMQQWEDWDDQSNLVLNLYMAASKHRLVVHWA